MSIITSLHTIFGGSKRLRCKVDKKDKVFTDPKFDVMTKYQTYVNPSRIIL